MAEVFFYGLIVAIPTALIGGLLLTNSRIIKQMQIIGNLQNKASIFEINNKSMSSNFCYCINATSSITNNNTYYNFRGN